MNKNFLMQKLEKLFEAKKSNLESSRNIVNHFFYKSLNYLITLELEEQFYLGFYNIAKRNYITTTAKEFQLHKAIFENNLKKINDICKNER